MPYCTIEEAWGNSQYNFIKEQEESKKNQNEAVSSDLSQEKKSASDQPASKQATFNQEAGL